jgi:hypothetical protein
MTMTVSEAGRLGGQKRAKDTGPKSLRGIGSLGYLRRAVIEVCNRAGELTEDERDRIFDALYGPTGDAA